MRKRQFNSIYFEFNFMELIGGNIVVTILFKIFGKCSEEKEVHEVTMNIPIDICNAQLL